MTPCVIDGCEKEAHYSQGWCPMHYQRWRRYGNPLVVSQIHGDVEARFLAYVEKTDGCWLWHGERNARGYGRLSIGRRKVAVHRWAYERYVGPIPDGLVIDHTCTNPSCVNPAHLEPVTQRENLLRGRTFQAANAAKTQCDSGHEFTPENTRIAANGSRHCKTCHRRWTREHRARVQAAA